MNALLCWLKEATFQTACRERPAVVQQAIT
jgi:hypothetical protein